MLATLRREWWWYGLVTLTLLGMGMAAARWGARQWDWMAPMLDWDMLTLVGVVLGSLALTGLPVVLVIWCITQAVKGG